MKQIIIERITRIYDAGKSNEVHALRGLDALLDSGKTYAIMGASGSGKTTLLNIMGCLDRPDGGLYRWDNVNICSYSKRALSKLRAQKIGFVLQDFGLIDHLTVIENCMAPAIFSGFSFREARRLASNALDKLHIAEFAKREVGKLSGGQKQRAAIARAIINQPTLLLADEPTGALDSKNSGLILDALMSLSNEDTIILLATHDKAAAARCDFTFHIKDGVIQTQQPK
jgi:putative ABC transport system ATP-binding protein